MGPRVLIKGIWYYTPATPAIERSPPVHDSTPTIVCFSCGDTMKHFRTISKLGVRPEQLIFVCPSYKGVDTKELISVTPPATPCLKSFGHTAIYA
jgi:hypothetical protein